MQIHKKIMYSVGLLIFWPVVVIAMEEQQVVLQGKDNSYLQIQKKQKIEKLKQVSHLVKDITEDECVINHDAKNIAIDLLVSDDALALLKHQMGDKKYSPTSSSLSVDSLIKLLREFDYLQADRVLPLLEKELASKLTLDCSEKDFDTTVESLKKVEVLPLLKNVLSSYQEINKFHRCGASFKAIYKCSFTHPVSATTFFPLKASSPDSSENLSSNYIVFYNNTDLRSGWYHYNLEQGSCSYVASAETKVEDFIFTKSGKFFLVWNANGSLDIRSHQNKLIACISDVHDDQSVVVTVISDDEQYIIVSSDHNERLCRVYSNTGEFIKTLDHFVHTAKDDSLSDSIEKISNSCLVTVGGCHSNDHTYKIRVWNLQKNTVTQIPSYKDDMSLQAYIVGSRNNHSIIWYPAEGVARVIDTNAAIVVSDIKLGDDEAVGCIFFTPNGKNIIAVSYKELVARVYDLNGASTMLINLNSADKDSQQVDRFSDTHMIIKRPRDLDVYDLRTGAMVTVAQCNQFVVNESGSLLAAILNPKAVSGIPGSPEKKKVTLLDLSNSCMSTTTIACDRPEGIIFLDDNLLCIYTKKLIKIIDRTGYVIFMRAPQSPIKEVVHDNGKLLIVCASDDDSSDTFTLWDFSLYFSLKKICSGLGHTNKENVISKIMLLGHYLRSRGGNIPPWVDNALKKVFDPSEQEALELYQQNLYPKKELDSDKGIFKKMARRVLVFNSDSDSD